MVAPDNFYNDVSKDWSCKWVLSNERIHVFYFTINITFRVSAGLSLMFRERFLIVSLYDWGFYFKEASNDDD